MKKRDISDIQTAAIPELKKKLTDLRKQITEAEMKRQTSEVKNVHTVKSLRQKVAVVMTVLTGKLYAEERKKAV